MGLGFTIGPKRRRLVNARCVFEQVVWLEVGSGKMALSHPAHQRVIQAVGQFPYKL